jgi:hypothetical protein
MAAATFLGRAMAAALSTGKMIERIPFWRNKNAAHRRKFARHFYGRSKYGAAHQGERECARRRRQIEKGIIHP